MRSPDLTAVDACRELTARGHAGGLDAATPTAQRTANPDRRASTLMVVYYDEHGGLWDHLRPPRIGYDPPAELDPEFAEPFRSLGPRVPALVVSPVVEEESVYSGLLDHTFVLQLLAEKYGDGEGYSPTVEGRR